MSGTDIATVYQEFQADSGGASSGIVVFTCPDGYLARMRSLCFDVDISVAPGNIGSIQLDVFDPSSVQLAQAVAAFNRAAQGAIYPLEHSESMMLGYGAVSFSVPDAGFKVTRGASPLPDIWTMPGTFYSLDSDFIGGTVAFQLIAGYVELLEAASVNPVQFGGGSDGSTAAAQIPFLLPTVGG